MDGWMDEWMKEWMDEWLIEIQACELINGRLDG